MSKNEKVGQAKVDQGNVGNAGNVKVGDDKYVALKLIHRILDEKKPLDEVLDLDTEACDARTRARIRDLVANGFRYRGRSILAIRHYSSHAMPKGKVRRFLELGLTQLFSVDRVPFEKIASEYVSLVKKEIGEGPSKFLNAMFRKVHADLHLWKGERFPAFLEISQQSTSAETLMPLEEKKALWANWPAEWWVKLREDYSEVELFQWAFLQLKRPRFTARIRGESEPRVFDQFSQLEKLLDEKPNETYVQDAATIRLIDHVIENVKAYGSAKSAAPGAAGIRALDFCASPGGKTIAMLWEGMDVLATDLEYRLPILKHNIEVRDLNCKIQTIDAIQAGEKFDLVWVDAPCSSLGITSKHPEIPWIKSAKEYKGVLETQAKVIQDSIQYLADGGTFAYSLCTPLIAERQSALFESLGFKLQEEISSFPKDKEWDAVYGAVYRKAK